MPPVIDPRAGDRILILGLPETGWIADLARRLPSGLIVAQSPDREQVAIARQECAGSANVMIVPSPLDEIPWREGFFSLAVLTEGVQLAELGIVSLVQALEAGGEFWAGNDEESRAALLAAGFQILDEQGAWMRLVRL